MSLFSSVLCFDFEKFVPFIDLDECLCVVDWLLSVCSGVVFSLLLLFVRDPERTRDPNAICVFSLDIILELEAFSGIRFAGFPVPERMPMFASSNIL